jgi:hypothetical protein
MEGQHRGSAQRPGQGEDERVRPVREEEASGIEAEALRGRQSCGSRLRIGIGPGPRHAFSHGLAQPGRRSERIEVGAEIENGPFRNPARGAHAAQIAAMAPMYNIAHRVR